MKISAYTTLFNVKFFSDFSAFVQNVLQVADELVVATIKDDFNFLSVALEVYPNVRLVVPEIEKFHPDFDGMMKDAALQACTGDLMIQIDADERFSSNFSQWKYLFEMFIKTPAKACFVPVLNLFKDEHHISDIGQKWYLHKPGLHRGVVNFARREDGTHDTQKSDSCELIDGNGNLVPTISYCNINQTLDVVLDGLRYNNYPFIYHLGWIDKKRRVNIINEFWQKQWNAEEGSEVPLPKSEEEINKDAIMHGLPLWI